MQQAIATGATEIHPARDYDYGYRQGEIKDLFRTSLAHRKEN
jgi:PhnB protein